MEIEMQRDGSWVASGDGELRPIVTEGITYEEAKQYWLLEFGNQYAEAQTLTMRSLMSHQGN